MLRARNFLVAFMLAATAFASATIEDSYSLLRTAKVGDESKYTFEAEMTFGEIKITIKGVNREKVTKVDGDKISVESVQSDVVVKTPEEEQAMGGEEKSFLTYGKDRLILESKDEDGDTDPSSVRLSLVTSIKAPSEAVKVGSKWSETIKSEIEDTYPVKANYEVVGTEKVGKWDCIKIKIESAETEGEEKASSSGHIWLSISNFETVKEVITIKNAPIAMAPTPIDLTVKSERVE